MVSLAGRVVRATGEPARTSARSGGHSRRMKGMDAADEPDRARMIEGDCLAVLPDLAPASVDSIVTDPPYGLEFMGKDWDRGVPGVRFWSAALGVLKPGRYALVMGSPRTYHRLACAVEDAGFQVRDCLMWLYGSGFPKGRGCLKPAWEPILLARRPGPRVLPLGIDACRIPGRWTTWRRRDGSIAEGRDDESANCYGDGMGAVRNPEHPGGRWPANVVHDGSAEVLDRFAEFGEKTSGEPCGTRAARFAFGTSAENGTALTGYGDTGTADRFFYCAKATREDREEGLPGRNPHPTVKPVALMRWLIRSVTPAGGLVLDPFAGSGSTGKAAVIEGARFLGIERDPTYCDLARRRIAAARPDCPLYVGLDAAADPAEDCPLFAGLD